MALRSNLCSFFAGACIAGAAGYYRLHQDVYRAGAAVDTAVQQLHERVHALRRSTDDKVSKLEDELSRVRDELAAVRATSTTERQRHRRRRQGDENEQQQQEAEEQ